MGPGASVEFSVLRPTSDGVQTLKKVTELQKAPLAATDAPEYESKSLEFKVRNLVFADYLFYNLDEDELSGVAVSELKQGGLSAVGGLQIGDVIQRVGNVPVASVDDVEAAMKDVDEAKPSEVIFFVWRDNKTLFVNVKTDWQESN
jgi:S1-C subfamily serine protease